MNTDENDEIDEIETDDVEMNETESDEPDVNPAAAFIDMVIDGNSVDAKDTLKGMLYSRIGDRIEAMKTDMRTKAWEGDVEVSDADPDVAELSFEETPDQEV